MGDDEMDLNDLQGLLSAIADDAPNPDMRRKLAGVAEQVEQLGIKAGDPGYPMPEAQILELKSLQKTYDEGCKFKPGDIVSAIKGRNLRGAGRPCVVLEVLENPELYNEDGDCTSHRYGRRLNLRVARYVDPRTIVSFWDEHYNFEYFNSENEPEND